MLTDESVSLVRLPECHPDKKYFAKNLCERCYYNNRNTKRRRAKGINPKNTLPFALCHTDRPHHAFELCLQCYRKQYGKAYRKKFKDTYGISDNTAWRRANPEKNKAHRWQERLKRYGITEEIYNQKLIEQEYLCVLCLNLLGSEIHIDHDHACCPTRPACGKCFRGLLHQVCNQKLGHFNDDIEMLRRAANYLEKSKRLGVY